MLQLPRKHKQIWRSALFTFIACTALAAAEHENHHVTGVRFWSLGDVTRVAVETDGDFRARSNRLHDPERLFFDFVGASPTDGKTLTIPVSDRLVRQIRVAETQHGVTRVVLDTEMAVEFTTSRLDSPERLIIEVRAAGAPVPEKAKLMPEDPRAVPVSAKSVEARNEARLAPPPESRVENRFELKEFRPPAQHAPIVEALSRRPQVALEPPPFVQTQMQSPTAGPSIAASMTPRLSVTPPPMPVKSITLPPSPVLPSAITAKRNASGDRSMIRVLGLKVGRVVIDAGHGGHDVGTTGPSGLREKDLVLDVARRLGKLVEDRMGSEVIYTRADDTFIPLERRTEIANEARADLFLSIHANSSPIAAASGVETYYLNFTTSRSALELAAKENSGSQKSIYELQDLLQKIALKDKVEESREFAGRIESALVPISVKSNHEAKDRGVKKAPFIVLIGASMPSVLAEIGFISNEHDEGNMKRPEYRQRIAEALYKGLANYANTLSHFQVAQRE